MKEKVATSLKKYNLVMGFFHLIQSSVLFFLIFQNDYLDTTIPIISRFFGIENDMPTQVVEQIVEVPVVLVAPTFLLMSAAAHFFISTIYYNTYISDLEKGINRARWWEYAFSSSLMIVVIAMLGGLIEIDAVVFIFTLNFLMNLFGLMMEKYNLGKKKIDWLPFNLGILAGIVPWIIMFIYFIASFNNFADASNDPIPNYAYISLVVIFLFFNSFAFNMFFQYKKIGPYKDYIFGEKGYILLSLVAKSILAWIIFFGVSNAGM